MTTRFYLVKLPLRGGDTHHIGIDCVSAVVAVARAINRAKTSGLHLEDGVVEVVGEDGKSALTVPVERDRHTGRHAPFVVTRCANCGSSNTKITHSLTNRPRRGYRLRYLECRDCGHCFSAEQAPDRNAK